MKSKVFILLVLIFSSCSKKETEPIVYAEKLVTSTFIEWSELGTVCEAPKTINGIGLIEIVFDGVVPIRGQIILRSKWKFDVDTIWTYDEGIVYDLSSLNGENDTIFIKNGFCWTDNDSTVACDIIYINDLDEEDEIELSLNRPN